MKPATSKAVWSHSLAPTYREALLPYVLLAPSALFLAAIFFVPLVQTFALSVTENGALSFANYRRMASDLNFRVAVRNTFLLALAVVPVQVALALGMGTMLQKLPRGRDLVLWIWTIPLGVSDLAAGLVWLAILQERGYLNSALAALGLLSGPTAWLTYETPVTLFFGVVLAEVWRATAIVFLILVAGMQLVPREYAEAAEIFGAKPWTAFRRVTLPLLKPTLQSALILRTVFAFEVFAVVYAIGGTNLPVLLGEAFVWQRDNQNYGVAAAYAVLIVAISVAATGGYLRALRTPPEQRP